MMLPLSACLMSWLIFRSCAAQISDMSVINCIIHDKNKKSSEYWYFPAFEFYKYWIIVRRWYLFTRWLNVKLVTKCEYRILLDFSCSVLVIFGITHAYASYRHYSTASNLLYQLHPLHQLHINKLRYINYILRYTCSGVSTGTRLHILIDLCIKIY